ncbi:hypothetical protein BRADI_2g26637v3 [Brachypodium distachyon]|uniref:Uncharacterized protein n=1 Tax=Brachypodium distachyon TaxID=15368 RepID=A0A2K2DAQ8_BRADI|nr:hypothetical protein BRADI_2g26637v3 [Brachypodium distachyon]
MVASFGRSKFKLTEVSVGNLLNVCLGGKPEEFRVTILKDRTFRFSVTNKAIGFHIAKLSSFECSNFVVYFHLWGFGGPDYMKEYAAWEEEQHQQWPLPKKPLSPQKSARSYAEAPSQVPRLTDHSPIAIHLCKENHIAKYSKQQKEPILVSTIFKRLKFPESTSSESTSVTEKTRFKPVNGKHTNGRLNNNGVYLGLNVNYANNASNAGAAFMGNEDLGPNTAWPNSNKPTCGRCLKSGHTAGTCQGVVHCRYCLKRAHFQGDCSKAGITSAGALRPRMNEDITIVNINPPPNPDKPFHVTRGIINNFIADHLRLRIEYLQLCPLGHEAEHVANAIADWGKLVLWDKSVSNYAIIVIKVKVEDPDFQGNTWAAPVYILDQALLGGLGPNEDVPPENGATPHPLPALPFHVAALPDLNMAVDNWGPWDKVVDEVVTSTMSILVDLYLGKFLSVCVGELVG